MPKKREVRRGGGEEARHTTKGEEANPFSLHMSTSTNDTRESCSSGGPIW